MDLLTAISETAQQAGIPGLIIVAGLLLLLTYLLAPKPKDVQEVKTALSFRGSPHPNWVGTRRITEWVFGWAGDRISQDESVGGKGFLFGGASQKVYYESGWHQLSGSGPGVELSKIFQNGELIWEGPINSVTHPSGTSITLDNGEGTFVIYWGEIDQPINTFLGSKPEIGIDSRWPYLFYIQWVSKRLGSSATWGQLEYVATIMCFGVGLNNSEVELEEGTGPPTKGMNPAYALLRWLYLPFPHGRGLTADQIDNTSIEELGVRATNEFLPVNFMFGSDEKFSTAIQAVLQDIGYWMPEIDGRLAFLPWRDSTDDLPEFGDDIIQPPLPEKNREMDASPSRTIFTFKSELNAKYRDVDIVLDDDADASQNAVFDPVSVEIRSFTDRLVASQCARRRVQEGILSTSIRLNALRGARLLQSGQEFIWTGKGRYLVISRRIADDTGAVELEAALEQYAIPDISDEIDQSTPSGGSMSAEIDIAFAWFELPDEITLDTAIAVLRQRAHQQMSGSRIYVAIDGVGSYSFADNQDYASAGGLLEEAIGAVTADILVVGPVFESANKDSANILDLSGDDPSWMAGRLIAVINDECFYIQSVTVQAESDWSDLLAYSIGDSVIPTGAPTGFRYRCTTAGTSAATEPDWPEEINETIMDGSVVWTCVGFAYQINNMIRARLGTVAAAHSIGDRVYIADRNQLTVIRHSSIAPGNDICIKSVPFTASQIVSIADVTGVCSPVLGGLDTENIRVTSDGDYRITQTGEFREHT